MATHDTNPDPGDLNAAFRDSGWRRVLVAAVLTDDAAIATLAATAGVSPELAVRVHDDAVAAGLLVNGVVDAHLAGSLTDGLTTDDYMALHAAAARHYATGGPDDLRRAITLARRAAGAITHEELLALSDRAAEIASERGEWAEAAGLYAEADALDPVRTSTGRAARLVGWATAAERTGDQATARTLRLRAFALADAADAPSLMTEAAVAVCFPPDWRDGDGTAMRLVARAEQRADNDADRARLTAVRAMLSNRVPAMTPPDDDPTAADMTLTALDPDGEGSDASISPLVDARLRRQAANHQVAWVTQPSVAQPLAEQAMVLATGTDDETELLAHLAWRTTHRAPRFLDRRWEVSQVAIELAQGLDQPERLVLGCVFGANDAIERADATGLERMVTLATWHAERSGVPRAVWYAHTLRAARALLADRLDQAEAHKAAALEIGIATNEPGTFSAEIFFAAQIALDRDDPGLMGALCVEDDHPVLASHLARAVHGLLQAKRGDHDAARRDLTIAVRGLDPEASYLLAATLAARTALVLGDDATMRHLVGVLSPWSHLVAIDSHAWWCAGPVSLTLAELHAALGDPDTARRQVAEAAYTAERLGDLRAVRRAQALWSALGTGEASATRDSRLDALTERERDVLALLAQGGTNPAIAERLSYSLATVRRDTIAIYRKLGVSGRVEATALAIAEGLVGESAGSPAVTGAQPDSDASRR